MQLAPITTIDRVRSDATQLALAADRVGRAVDAPFPAGAPVAGDLAERLALTLDAANDVLRRADASATSAVTWEHDARLGVSARQVREGVEELYDVVYDAAALLREATVVDAIPSDLDGGPIADLRRAAVVLGAVARDLVDTIDGAALVAA